MVLLQIRGCLLVFTGSPTLESQVTDSSNDTQVHLPSFSREKTKLHASLFLSISDFVCTSFGLFIHLVTCVMVLVF
jgi:hypothetical protein